jgi:arsenite methyltransferase
MGVRQRFLAAEARQLGRPEGVAGRLVGRMLNRGNRKVVIAAVDAAAPCSPEVVADLGFGGGLGLRLLLERVGPSGHVHGVELSTTMLAEAGRCHREDIEAGRLSLHPGRLEQLPLDDRALDALITLNTLYFVDDVTTVFAELARVLRPGGRAVVGVGDAAAMAAMPVTRTGFRLRPADELVDELTAAGFEVRHERVGEGVRVFHLLVATSTARG